MFHKQAPTFEAMSLELASQFDLDLNDITETYRDQEPALRNLFNMESDAKHRRNVYGAVTVFMTAATVASGFLASPLTVTAGTATAYQTYKNNKTLGWVGNQLRAEIAKKPAAVTPVAAPANP